MTLTMAQAHDGSQTACPSCGESLPHSSAPSPEFLEAQKQIEDLQAQVRLLNQKAASAGMFLFVNFVAENLNIGNGLLMRKPTVDKWADYEDEIHRLRLQNNEAKALAEEEQTATPSRFSYLPVQNRLSSFLTTRKSTPNLQPPPSPSTEDLTAALEREQALRQAAEGKLNEASGELEDLTAQLFEQANEMVATERKARAKLEARVEVLERRDGEKRKRLEKLEGAMQRIERVRGLLAPGR